MTETSKDKMSTFLSYKAQDPQRKLIYFILFKTVVVQMSQVKTSAAKECTNLCQQVVMKNTTQFCILDSEGVETSITHTLSRVRSLITKTLI